MYPSGVGLIMKLDTFSTPKSTLVRQGFTDQDTWRETLGNLEPLHCFSLLGGCIDAPNVIPSGGMKSGKHGVFQIPSFRD
jgi:hypothetical protein